MIIVPQLIRTNWFLCGIVFVICLASVAPTIGAKGGILRPEITVKFVAVFIIFFNSGISLRSEDLTRALVQFKLHIFIQGWTFVIFPLVINLLVSLLKDGLFEKLLLQGLLVLGCMPPPVSSAVILTKSVSGNEAAAIFNSAVGSFLGIFITPSLILLNHQWPLLNGWVSCGCSSQFHFCATVTDGCTAPVCGSDHQETTQDVAREKSHPLWDHSAILLMIIYTTFCDTFSQAEIDLDFISFISIVFMIVILQCALLWMVFYITTRSWLNFHPKDTTAIMFCSTHKSLTLGIPIMKIVFSGDPGLSVITIPLLVYHPTQILLGGLLVPPLKEWMFSVGRKKYESELRTWHHGLDMYLIHGQVTVVDKQWPRMCRMDRIQVKGVPN
ncbi:sodium/bile acid cotransporter 7-like isoform X3 [Ostrea edulis]|uniref:sodium/bile acid cotransporter 7-like isoform X3 n=1 Tax=Ostrea edulis TaxID=37623 RepID=UPI00209594DE|nr:sodium/bile acid cotransporter 7-like isoform X3 [Ostrea edulis]